MISIARCVLEWLEANPGVSASEAFRLLDLIPQWQWETWWSDLRTVCPSRLVPRLARRPANALCLEIGQASDRCDQRAPDGRGLAWLLSGGDVLAYGCCEARACPFFAAGGRTPDSIRPIEGESRGLRSHSTRPPLLLAERPQ